MLHQSNENNGVDGLAQDCSNSIANALVLLQSCTKPLICSTAIKRTLSGNIITTPPAQFDI